MSAATALSSGWHLVVVAVNLVCWLGVIALSGARVRRPARRLWRGEVVVTGLVGGLWMASCLAVLAVAPVWLGLVQGDLISVLVGLLYASSAAGLAVSGQVLSGSASSGSAERKVLL